MLENMKNEISNGISKICKSGEVNAQELKDCIEIAVSKAVISLKNGLSNVNEITKEAIETSIKELEKTKIEVINAKEKSNTFIEEEIKEIISDLESLDNSFKESLLNVANKVNNITEESIRKNIAEIKDSSEKTISEVREIAKGAISGMINGAKDAMKKDS